MSAPIDPTVLTEFIDELHREFPSFRIVRKAESRFAKAMDVALKILTLGGQREFMGRYYTVIGDTLYVPIGWDETNPLDAVITLRHERIHLRQRRRLTFPVMILVYLFLPLPLGLAYGRARLEWEAYSETLRATLELRGPKALQSAQLKERIVTQFTSPAYGWMWPFRSAVEGWYDAKVRELLAVPPLIER